MATAGISPDETSDETVRPARVSEQTTDEEYLETSIEYFVVTRPTCIDELRNWLGTALALRPIALILQTASSKTA